MAYPIGTKFLSSGKHKRLCEIEDIYKTYNEAGELVKVRYVASYEFLGRRILDHDVNDVTVAMGIDALAKANKTAA